MACFSLFIVTSIDSIQKNMRNRFRNKMEADIDDSRLTEMIQLFKAEKTEVKFISKRV